MTKDQRKKKMKELQMKIATIRYDLAVGCISEHLIPWKKQKMENLKKEWYKIYSYEQQELS